MATYNITMQRYNGTSWDELRPKTSAAQVIQSTTQVFLHPTTNKINDKAFGTLKDSVWTPDSITLYGSDISLTSSDSTTISSKISSIDTSLAKCITSSSAFTATDEILVTATTSGRTAKTSGYFIETTFTGANTNVPTSGAVATYLGSWSGTSNITKVGTITSGTWNGSTISISKGGTGATTASAARTNLGLGTAATYTATNSASDITSATSTTTKLPTTYAVQQYVADVKITYKIVWLKSDYESTTEPTTAILANIPAGVVVKYKNGAATATGTLTAEAAQVNKILMVYDVHGTQDAYDEYLCVADADEYKWEKLGNTDIDLSGYVKADSSWTTNQLLIAKDNNTAKSYYNVSTSGDYIQSSDNTHIPTTKAVNDFCYNKFTGSNKIVTLGTITTGIWNGSTIGSDYIANLASSKITAMTNYLKATSSSAITTTDSLNTAIGKLEYKADNNATNITSLTNRAQIFWSTSTSVTGAKNGDFVFVYSAA